MKLPKFAGSKASSSLEQGASLIPDIFYSDRSKTLSERKLIHVSLVSRLEWEIRGKVSVSTYDLSDNGSG